MVGWIGCNFGTMYTGLSKSRLTDYKDIHGNTLEISLLLNLTFFQNTILHVHCTNHNDVIPIYKLTDSLKSEHSH
jgi:hypothetical protein